MSWLWRRAARLLRRRLRPPPSAFARCLRPPPTFTRSSSPRSRSSSSPGADELHAADEFFDPAAAGALYAAAALVLRRLRRLLSGSPRPVLSLSVPAVVVVRRVRFLLPVDLGGARVGGDDLVGDERLAGLVAGERALSPLVTGVWICVYICGLKGMQTSSADSIQIHWLQMAVHMFLNLRLYAWIIH